MPGIDGLDTIRELQHEYPDALYILSTAYERFDLAQRAIPLRVFAYLVKPVSRKRFMETMFRAKDELDEQRERFSSRLEEVEHDAEALSQEVRNFILLITWKSLDETTWRRYRRLFQLTSDYGVVAAVEAEKEELYPQIAERVERKYRILRGENMHRLIIFVAGAVPPEQAARTIRAAVEEVTAPGERTAVGIGSRRRYDEFYRSCDEAIAALPAEAGTEERLRRFRAASKEFIRTVSRVRDAEEAISLYEGLSDDAFAGWGFHTAAFRIAAAFERLVDDYDARVGDPETSSLIADPVADLVGMDTRREVDAWAKRVLRRLVEEQLRLADDRRPEALKAAVRHIERHYAEPVQLTDLADRSGVSAGYLSRLFSEHLGVSFNDYLNSVRLETARRLLESGGGPVKEIAYTVGYQDPNYFSRIFKKFTGVSPTDYAQRRERDA